MELHGRTALVTGGARRVGRAITLALAKAGARVAIHYHNSEADARALADEIHAAGGQAATFRADLADPAQIETLFAALGEAFERLDILVNSAGVYHRTPIETLSAEEWDLELAANARSAALCMRYVVAMMPDGGAIVNLTDIAAERGSPGYLAYTASKGAVLTMTKSAARALAGRGIRVNAVAPGVALWPEGISEEQKARVLAHVPMRRPGTPEDIAAAVLFLLRQDYITGQNLRVDGGWHMG